MDRELTLELDAEVGLSGDGDSWILVFPDPTHIENDTLVMFNWPSDPTRTLPEAGRFAGARYTVGMEFRPELDEEPSLEVGDTETRIASRAEYPLDEELRGIELLDLPDDYDYHCVPYRNSRFVEEYPDYVTDRSATYGVVLTFEFDEDATPDEALEEQPVR